MPVEDDQPCGQLDGRTQPFAPCRIASIFSKGEDNSEASWIKSKNAGSQSIRVSGACVWYDDQDSFMNRVGMLGGAVGLVTLRE